MTEEQLHAVAVGNTNPLNGLEVSFFIDFAVVQRFRGSNHIDIIPSDLILRSALFLARVSKDGRESVP